MGQGEGREREIAPEGRAGGGEGDFLPNPHAATLWDARGSVAGGEGQR